MNGFSLPESIRYCEIGEERVFLDLERDLYFCLPPPLAAAFAALERTAAPFPSAAALDALIQAGIVARCAGGRRIAPTRHPRPTQSLAEQPCGRARLSLALIAETVTLVSRARRAVAKKKLSLLLERLSGIAPCERGPPEVRDRWARRFLAARRLVPAAPNCLTDSLALCLFLRRRGLAGDLVIGAKLLPFAAHCWLQDGELVLNDALGAARDFEPLLVA